MKPRKVAFPIPGGPLPESGGRPFPSAAVSNAYAAFPPGIARRLLAVRELIFETAAGTPGVGAIEETLKWGEPAYLPGETGSGTTVRVGWKKSAPTRYAIYFHCQTDLVERFRVAFPDEFRFEGNRAIVMEEDEPLPVGALATCIAEAFLYHARKRFGREPKPGTGR